MIEMIISYQDRKEEGRIRQKRRRTFSWKIMMNTAGNFYNVYSWQHEVYTKLKKVWNRQKT